jgi:hypothetical protein
VHGATDGIKFKPSATKRPTRVPPDSLFLTIENCTDEAAKKVLMQAFRPKWKIKPADRETPTKEAKEEKLRKDKMKKRYDDFHIFGVAQWLTYDPEFTGGPG